MIDTYPPSDAEEPIRKRQRTRSPEDQPAVTSNWEDQQKAAKFGGSLPKNPLENHGRTEDVAERPNQQDAKPALGRIEPPIDVALPASQASDISDDLQAKAPVTRTPPKKMLRMRPNGKFASPKARKENLVTPTGESPKVAAPLHQPATIAPKKILEITADGKLGLPKAKAPPEVAKRQGQKRNSALNTNFRTVCIAVMGYGADNGTKASLGQQVDEILLGSRKNQGSKPNGLFGVPKSTHPFFTGELGRKTDTGSESASTKLGKTGDLRSSQHQQAERAENIFGPRESRITSKPPRVALRVDVACDAGFPTFGTDHARLTRFPGAQDPIWPPYEMFHVRDPSSNFADACKLPVNGSELRSGRKMKDVPIQILSQENILNSTIDLVHLYEGENEGGRKISLRDARQFRRPLRKVMTGNELQQAISPRVTCSLPSVTASGCVEEDELSSSQSSEACTHKSLLNVYDRIPHSRTAFDQFRCEMQEWAHKYSPKSAEDVLQQGREAVILRDWLKESTVSSIGGGLDKSRTRESSVIGRRGGVKSGRRKKRRAEELDGFVVSSDEEANQMDEIGDVQDVRDPRLHEKKSVMRAGTPRDGERTANAVVISGPHGCGKTAAVFAVAKELDFEVFEVNAGSRRSGKDILDKVGDLTRNHLVKHRREEEGTVPIYQSLELPQADEKLQADLDSGRQGTMQSFFQVKSPSKTKARQAKDKPTKPERGKRGPKNTVQEVFQKPRDQQQSLILLEEVDILFEEDKSFWATVLDLILRSKRPVIMTCSDESLLPMDDMALYAILRFSPPPVDLATDYLLLVAANEGHLLSRESVQLLLNAKDVDLRAALAELNFHCQMGVGDSKGGLEWMLIDKPAPISQSGHSENLRVISEGTYCSGMGWLGGEDISARPCQTLGEITELCAEVWNGWHVDIGSTDASLPAETTQTRADSREQVWQSLQRLDRSCEASSAADVLPASVVRWEDSVSVDTALPNLTDRARFNYIEGPKLLLADPVIDHTGTSDYLALALRAFAITTSHETEGSPFNVQKIINTIPQGLRQSQQLPTNTLPKLLSTFLPIANDPLVASAVSKGLSSSIFDGPVSVILQDVAPYIRGIVSYDLRLEEQRCQLSALLTRPGVGNKKTRTTRASRAALEGGNKANTRRERWFPKQTNFDSVLDTGGKGWQKTALRVLMGHTGDQSAESCESRRSSFASGDGADI